MLGSNDADPEQHFDDATALLDYGFEAFRRVEPLPAGGAALTYRWPGRQVRLLSAETLGRTVADRVEDVVLRTRVTPDLPLPQPEGAEAGSVELLINGEVVDASPLVTAAAVRPPRQPDAPASHVGATVESALRTFARLHAIDTEL